jgi:hypothetical protein
MARIFLPPTVQHHQGGEKMALFDLALQGAAVHGHILGLAAAAINDAGDQPLLAGLEGRALARAVTRFHLKFLNLRHFPDPSVPGKRPLAPGKSRLVTEGRRTRNRGGMQAFGGPLRAEKPC